MCPAGCGKKFITADHAEWHVDAEHPDWRVPKPPKARGWATPYGFVDFSYPITYEEACEFAKGIRETPLGKAIFAEKEARS